MTGNEFSLAHFTFRELLTQKALAESALRRGRKPSETQLLIQRIDAELTRRRTQRFSRAADGVPDLPEN